MNRITGIAPCCARTASGHAAALLSSVMNPLRFIRFTSSVQAGTSKLLGVALPVLGPAAV
jgi:hypothetical protein